ncbi:MAG: exo-alpha-sialidase [Blastocatellia bacterium]|nr:exo-alpha-sialidase [Blastocatellia bacterium]MCS7158585.1 exo-alpha-sialidase [Blastocatellia bacterium]MDW8169289.1 exo-alpha-sialidase [Acidobacteriota bacterium]MDW8257781.1 exo-alpha-sialidase [Acidobacteriota bacterium]
MRIIDRGVIFDATSAPLEARFCTFPSLARLESGRLIVGFRSGSSKDSADEDVRIMASDDGGYTWQMVLDGFGEFPPGSGGRIRCIALTALGTRLIASLAWVDRSDPTRPLANPQTQGLLPTKVFFTWSEDDGRSWVTPHEVPLAPHKGNATTGSLLLLKDGRLALPYEAWKEYDDPRPGHHHAALRISADGGMTWDEMAIVAHDPSGQVLYWDQRLTMDPETGELIAMFWTYDRQAQQDRDIHIAWGSPDARQWSQPVSIGIAGQICAPLALGDGRVFAAYVHRHDPPSLRAILSDDFGRTWRTEEEIVFYEKKHGGRESGMGGKRAFDEYWVDMGRWTFGHPTPLLLPDGTVFVAFYAGDETAMGIQWVRLAL